MSLGFPPNALMLSRTHDNASHWSLNPKFPSILGSSLARKPNADSLYPMFTQTSERSAAMYCACELRPCGDPNCK